MHFTDLPVVIGRNMDVIDKARIAQSTPPRTLL
jgi:hypothetical protein